MLIELLDGDGPSSRFVRDDPESRKKFFVRKGASTMDEGTPGFWYAAVAVGKACSFESTSPAVKATTNDRRRRFRMAVELGLRQNGRGYQ